jgi:hypothetical protein
MVQPRNFFTEYLEALPKLKKLIHPADYLLAEKTASMFRSQGVMFALPPGGELTDRTPKTAKGTSLRPPYEYVVLEYESTGEPVKEGESDCPKRIVLACDVGDRVVLMPCIYNGTTDQWVPHIYMATLDLTDNNTLYVEDGELKVMAKYSKCLPKLFDANFEMWLGTKESFVAQVAKDLRDEINTYVDFCCAIHRHEVVVDDVCPDTASNRMRRARGKVPLFTYKVLTVGKKKRRSEHQGGTHASPRSHLRRGYYRMSRNGVRHWVKPCMVKGETPGFVHKDYRVEKEQTHGTNTGSQGQG